MRKSIYQLFPAKSWTPNPYGPVIFRDKINTLIVIFIAERQQVKKKKENELAISQNTWELQYSNWYLQLQC